MSDFSLVPVDHQPEFGDVTFIPVDHDPFGPEDMSQADRRQPEGQLQSQTTDATAPAVSASAVDAPAAQSGEMFDPDSTEDRVAGQAAVANRTSEPISDRSRPNVDWSAYNRPTGELRAATFTPTQRIGYLASDALMGLGMKPYTANDLTSRVGNVLGLTPLGVAGSALDLIDAKRRADLAGAAIAAAGMIPGGRGGGRAAKGLAMDLESRLARAKEMGFFTQMPLYHGSGSAFDAIKSVPTDAPGRVLPGVSLSSNPEIANEFAAKARDRGLGEHPQVYKLLHRAENPARLIWTGDEDFEAVSATIRDAFDKGHDSVIIHNYTTAGGKKGDILIVRDGNQLRSVNAAFNPAKRDSNNLLYGLAGAAMAPLVLDGQNEGSKDGK